MISEHEAPPWRENYGLTLPGGRRLVWAEYGAAGGVPVFYFHGFPGSRYEARIADPAAREAGVRLIAIDRPGCGGSDDLPGRTLLAWPADVTAVAHAVGIERYAALGLSGGAPYALACARALGDRLACVALVAGLGPMQERAAAAAMSPVARLGFALARHAPRAARWIYGDLICGYLRRHPDAVFALLGGQGGAADRAVLARSDVRSALLASLQGALSGGAAGVTRDLTLYAQPWGFELEDIRADVRVWHGEADRTVPVAFARAFARRLPRCTARLLPHEGHFSLPVLYMAEILRPLRDLAAARG